MSGWIIWWMDQWMDESNDGWLSEWMDERGNEKDQVFRGLPSGFTARLHSVSTCSLCFSPVRVCAWVCVCLHVLWNVNSRFTLEDRECAPVHVCMHWRARPSAGVNLVSICVWSQRGFMRPSLLSRQSSSWKCIIVTNQFKSPAT